MGQVTASKPCRTKNGSSSTDIDKYGPAELRADVSVHHRGTGPHRARGHGRSRPLSWRMRPKATFLPSIWPTGRPLSPPIFSARAASSPSRFASASEFHLRFRLVRQVPRRMTKIEITPTSSDIEFLYGAGDSPPIWRPANQLAISDDGRLHESCLGSLPQCGTDLNGEGCPARRRNRRSVGALAGMSGGVGEMKKRTVSGSSPRSQWPVVRDKI